jgi:DNA-binding PadR family transcriptional regulator
VDPNLPRASALEPEYLILGLLLQQPGHGYDLHLRLQAEFRSLWRIPQNQLYSTLKRLETRGDILGEERDSSAGPKRRHYKVTRRGRARFRRWLERPTPMSVRALRVAFLTRLTLALADDQELAARIFEAQRKALQGGVAQLKQMTADSARAGTLTGLSLDLRVRQLETTLAWLENAWLELGLSSKTPS